MFSSMSSLLIGGSADTRDAAAAGGAAAGGEDQHDTTGSPAAEKRPASSLSPSVDRPQRNKTKRNRKSNSPAAAAAKPRKQLAVMTSSTSTTKRLRDGKLKQPGGIDNTNEQQEQRKQQPKKKQKKEPQREEQPAANKRSRPARTWEEFFQSLQAYKNKYHDCNVPAHYKEDRTLGQWVGKLRHGTINLSAEQRRQLTALGFNWETMEQKIEREWNQHYERLVLYRQQFGDCRVPKKPKTLPKEWEEVSAKEHWANEIGNWVAQQRSYYQQGRLNEVRKSKLENIGFDWSILAPRKEPDRTKMDQRWTGQYHKLVEFRHEYGHTMVTLTHHDTTLFTWIKRQREVHSRGLIRPDRKKLLDDLGFCWEMNDADARTSHNQRQWESMFALLQEYQQKEGHVQVPVSDLPLGNWLARQKVVWRRGELHHDRVDRLHAIGVRKEKEKANKIGLQISL